MSLRQLIRKFTVVLAGLLITLPVTLQAGEVASPVIPKAGAQATAEFGCVAPVTDMRKNHMKYLMHQRDDTMREGIRTEKNSLAKCISCHVTPDESGKIAHYGDDNHFCSSCHKYTAVNIDCFGCHNDRPDETNISVTASGGTN